MILLQILAGMLLVPLTVLIIILFNIYLMNWIYLSAMAIFALVYSLLFGLACHDSGAAAGIFVILAMLYVIRMTYLAHRLRAQGNGRDYPSLQGRIYCKNFHLRMVFYFPLSFLKILRLLPGAVDRELSRKAGFKVELGGLIELILKHSIGARIEVTNGEADFYFEIC